MWKALFVLFCFYNVLLIVSSQETVEEYQEENSASSRSSAQTSSQTSRSSDCVNNGKSKKIIRSDSSSSSSSSSNESSDSSSSVSSKKVTNRCKKNERWVECPPILCVPMTCDELGKPISCPRIIPGQCPVKPACVCIEGYVRDSNGVCIPKKKCPSCADDSNAESGCGFLCGKRCGPTTPVPKPCPCEINGCQCKSGFIYDVNQKKCVCPSQCSKPCAKNEVWSTCSNGGCKVWNCTDLPYGTLCIDPSECKGGCVCKKDYVRSKSGACISKQQCEKELCPKKNQVFDPCPLGCPRRECGVNIAAVSCLADQPCLPAGCRCRDETYRNKNGDCVPWEECPPETDPCTDEPITVSPIVECPGDLEERITIANANLTGLFLYNSMISKPGENLIMSAFSLLTPIAELCYFSEGETLRQFLAVLNFISKEHIRCIFPSLLHGLTADPNVILKLAVRIFATNKYPLTQNFLDYTDHVFGAEPESLNFADGAGSAKRVNVWASNATNGRITDIATPDMFTPDTRLVLANAIYFLGNWVHQFNVDNTEDREFYVSKDNVVKIPTMYQQNTFKYGHSDKIGAQLLEMSYKGNNFSMFIVLPDDKEGLASCVEKMRSPSKFYEAYDSTSYEKCNVYIPKMEIESSFDLADILKAAGLTDVFDPSKSQLTGILQQPEPLYISEGKQKSFGLVDEKGTEAAAVNVIVVAAPTAVMEPPRVYMFNANHPFIFYIMHTNYPIFSGIFTKP